MAIKPIFVEPKKDEPQIVQSAPVTGHSDEPTVTPQRKLFNEKKYSEILDLKKKRKTNLAKMGFTIDEQMVISGWVAEEPEPIKEEPVMETKTEEAPAKAGNTPREMFTRKEWGKLWTMQKSSKKGWAYYGFTPQEIERIKTNKPDYI